MLCKSRQHESSSEQKCPLVPICYESHCVWVCIKDANKQTTDHWIQNVCDFKTFNINFYIFGLCTESQGWWPTSQDSRPCQTSSLHQQAGLRRPLLRSRDCLRILTSLSKIESKPLCSWLQRNAWKYKCCQYGHAYLTNVFSGNYSKVLRMKHKEQCSQRQPCQHHQSALWLEEHSKFGLSVRQVKDVQATIEETSATLAAPLERTDGSFSLYWGVLSLNCCSLWMARLNSGWVHVIYNWKRLC